LADTSLSQETPRAIGILLGLDGAQKMVSPGLEPILYPAYRFYIQLDERLPAHDEVR
jgi:hypothetical protein